MSHIELSIEKAGLKEETVEMLIAFLMDAGFESFEEDNFSIKAFCSEGHFNTDFDELLNAFPQKGEHSFLYSVRNIQETNWNEKWEKSFSPIIIDDKILIKAPFHAVGDMEYTITIEPKMSFGTGHHETTRLMLRQLLRAEVANKEVLDMGCGTGILAIAARMMGASYVLAVDVDRWAHQNTLENFQRNRIEQPWDVLPGDVSAIEGHTFHLILANINRNILLNDLDEYYKALKDNGTLIVSGILSGDKDAILIKATNCGFTFVDSDHENNWISINLKK